MHPSSNGAGQEPAARSPRVDGIPSRRPILLTGSHRSGSTWVGQMIAACKRVGYIYEPFNVTRRNLGHCGASFPYWFTYVCPENEARYYPALRRTLSYRFDWASGVREVRRWNHARRLLKNWLRFQRYRIRNARPLVKDPLALLSAEWLAGRFGADVVVLVRHPAAFVGSVKSLGWRHDFSGFLAQPELMRDHFAIYRDEIESFAREERDLVSQAAFLWKLLYHVVGKYREARPDWIYVRHEDLSSEPVERFRELFERLSLPFDTVVQRTVEEYSRASNPVERPAGRTQLLRRDSRSNVWSWKGRLSAKEIDRVRAETEDVARLFYSDQDW